jgi:hypothetical protein
LFFIEVLSSLPYNSVQLLVFTGHPYLHLPAITLPLWGQLLRETVPSVAAAAGAKLPGMRTVPSGSRIVLQLP